MTAWTPAPAGSAAQTARLPACCAEGGRGTAEPVGRWGIHASSRVCLFNAQPISAWRSPIALCCRPRHVARGVNAAQHGAMCLVRVGMPLVVRHTRRIHRDRSALGDWRAKGTIGGSVWHSVTVRRLSIRLCRRPTSPAARRHGRQRRANGRSAGRHARGHGRRPVHRARVVRRCRLASGLSSAVGSGLAATPMPASTGTVLWN
jgi:hypothetical protein